MNIWNGIEIMPCENTDHDFVPLVMERNSHGILCFTARYCRKCGMVTDDRKMALRLIRAMENCVLQPVPEKQQQNS